jgi:hypothetical protein
MHRHPASPHLDDPTSLVDGHPDALSLFFVFDGMDASTAGMAKTEGGSGWGLVDNSKEQGITVAKFDKY